MTVSKNLIFFAVACCLYFGINSFAGDLATHLTYSNSQNGLSGSLDVNKNLNGTYTVKADLFESPSVMGDDTGPSCHLEETFTATGENTLKMVQTKSSSCAADLVKNEDGSMSFHFSDASCSINNCGEGLSLIDESSKIQGESIKFQ